MTLEEMKRIKQERGFSLAQLSEYSGVPLGTLQKIFSGATASPRYATKQAIEQTLRNSETAQMPTSNHLVQEPLAYQVDTSDTAEKKPGDYTLEDYYTMPDDRRVELIDGVIYDMGAPLLVHQQVVCEIHVQLANQIRKKGGSCMTFVSPVDVNLDKDDKTMVQPDVLIICDKDKLRRWGIYGAPDFVLEVVSPGSTGKDYIKKLLKYQNAGVKEYWIIDPDNHQLTVYDLIEEGRPEVHELRGTLGLKMYDGEISINLDEINALIIDWPEH